MSRDESDRKLVAKAGPWRSLDSDGQWIARVIPIGVDGGEIDDAAVQALARIANRIVREERGKGKSRVAMIKGDKRAK